MKVVKIFRIDDWLDVVHEDCIYLQFGNNHSINEANDLYKKFASQPERLSEPAQCIHEWTGVPTTEESWCVKCNVESHEVLGCDSLNTANNESVK